MDMATGIRVKVEKDGTELENGIEHTTNMVCSCHICEQSSLYETREQFMFLALAVQGR